MGAGTMPDGLRSVLLGTAGLWAAGVAALLLTLARTGLEADSARLTSTARLAAVTVFVQAAHFAEEFATGFYRRFPELLGLSPWSPRVFLTLNLFWLGIWCVSIGGLKARRRVALFPLWFLGIACVVNAVRHAGNEPWARARILRAISSTTLNNSHAFRTPRNFPSSN